MEERVININGRTIEIKKEEQKEFKKITRSLNGVEICSDKQYENGSYDKKSKVIVTNDGIIVSRDYINFTTCNQQYDSKTKTYTDVAQTPLIDENGKVIGEQESIEIYNLEDGKRKIQVFSTIEGEKGYYYLETISNSQGEDYKETSNLTIDNKLSGNKEKVQYVNENGKEIYIYMENGVIGEKITKTDKGITIDKYKDGKPDFTYEYDENGKAIIQMEGLDQLPEDYVKKCFEMSMPEYKIITHEEPEEIYIVDKLEKQKEEQKKIQKPESKKNITKQEITQKLGKETLDIQSDITTIDNVQKQIYEHAKEQTKGNNYKINEFGEILR